MVVPHRSLVSRAAQLASNIPFKPHSTQLVSQFSSNLGSPRPQRPVQGQHGVPLNVRVASTSQEITGDARSLVTRTKNLLLGTTIGLALVFGYYYITDTRAGVHQWLFVPSLRWIYDDAEEAHELGVKVLKGLYGFGIHPRERGNPDGTGILQVEVRWICRCLAYWKGGLKVEN